MKAPTIAKYCRKCKNYINIRANEILHFPNDKSYILCNNYRIDKHGQRTICGNKIRVTPEEEHFIQKG